MQLTIELLQEAKITFEEQAKVIDAITQHRQTFKTGTESETDAMRNTALIFKKVNIGGKQFAVGVIGPKRMNYSKVIEMLNGLAIGIDRIFGDTSLPPGHDE